MKRPRTRTTLGATKTRSNGAKATRDVTTALKTHDAVLPRLWLSADELKGPAMAIRRYMKREGAFAKAPVSWLVG